MFKKVVGTKHLVGRLQQGVDLLEGLTEVCTQNDVRLGSLEAIGALRKARLGYYAQDAREYRFTEIAKQLELVALVGNVSLKDGSPFVHAHVTVSDEEGNVFGGHLAPGTVVFICEFCIHVLEGAELTRTRDEQTGLPLWKECHCSKSST